MCSALLQVRVPAGAALYSWCGFLLVQLFTVGAAACWCSFLQLVRLPAGEALYSLCGYRLVLVSTAGEAAGWSAACRTSSPSPRGREACSAPQALQSHVQPSGAPRRAHGSRPPRSAGTTTMKCTNRCTRAWAARINTATARQLRVFLNKFYINNNFLISVITHNSIDREKLVASFQPPVPVRDPSWDDTGDVDGWVLLAAAHNIEPKPLIRLWEFYHSRMRVTLTCGKRGNCRLPSTVSCSLINFD